MLECLRLFSGSPGLCLKIGFGPGTDALQEIHSLPTKITDGLNSVGNYRRNIDGTKHIIFSTFLLPFTDRIPTENY